MHSLFTFYFYEFGHVLWQLVGDNKVNESVFCRKRKKKVNDSGLYMCMAFFKCYCCWVSKMTKHVVCLRKFRCRID